MRQTSFRYFIMSIALLCLQGCTVLAIADAVGSVAVSAASTAVSAASTAASLATDAAVGTARITGKVVGAAVDMAIPDKK
jgi:hypothetical protein